MEHNKFRVIVTGRYKKQIDEAIAAERIGQYSEITPTQALALIQSKESQVLHESIEHAKAYQIKRFLQDSGVEIKLEPALSYFGKVVDEKKEPEKKLGLFNKIVNVFRKKEVVEKQVNINWEEKPRFNRSIVIHKKASSSFLSTFLTLTVFGFAGWYLWNNPLSFRSTGDAFDENGEATVLVFTTKNCGEACQQVLSALKTRRVPFEHHLIDPEQRDDEWVKIWQSNGRGKIPLILAGDEKLSNSSNRQIGAMLGKVFGSKYLTQIEKPLYQKHFLADGLPVIAIYGAQWCAPCTKLKQKLTQAGIEFNYIDMDKVGNKQMVAQAMEIQGYPAVWYGYNRMRKIDFNSVLSATKK
jgi:glutaredoxin